ncbi:MAG: hypothetical protein ACTSUS_05795 [Candidatus Freyarchaeota archaeon]
MNRLHFSRDKNLTVKAASIMLIVLMASVSIMPSWSPARSLEASSPCGGCEHNTSTKDLNIKILNITIPKGEKKSKALAMVLSSEDYNNVKVNLTKRGYKALLDDALVQVINFISNGTEIEATIVTVPFEGEDELFAGILFFDFKKQTVAISAIVDLENEKADMVVVSVGGKLFDFSPSKTTSVKPCGSGDISTLSQDECQTDEDCQELYDWPWCYCEPSGGCEVLDYECYYNCHQSNCAWIDFSCLLCLVLYKWALWSAVCGIICVLIGASCANYCGNQCCEDWRYQCECEAEPP